MKDVKIKFKFGEKEGKLFSVKNSTIRIYSEACSFDQIKIHLLKNERDLQETVRNLGVISWDALAEHLKSRSSSDIRHYWQNKLLP
jgi:hypothetical protein